MAEQHVFDLPHRTALGRQDFFVAPCNALAVALMDAPDSWAAGAAVLYGPPGSGKTHLAHVFAAAQKGRVVEAAGADIARLAEHVAEPLVVEFPAAPEDETGLFHLVNAMREARRVLLLTFPQRPAALNLKLPDLRSRLLAMPAAELQPPDDRLLGAVLVKLAVDRQMRLPPALVGYAVARMERSFAAARNLIVALDKAALATKRPPTLPLLRQVMAQQGTASDLTD